MRVSTLGMIAVALTIPVNSSRGQIPRPRIALGLTASMTSSPGCGECDWGTTRDLSAGVMFRDTFTFEYRHVNWKGLDRDNQSMGLDLGVLELRVPGRLSPAMAIGVGRGSAMLDQSWGGHYLDRYAARNALAATFGIGLDIRLRGRLTLTPLIDAQGVDDVAVTSCMTSYDGFGHATTSCAPAPPTRLTYTAYGIRLGWR